MRNIKKRHSTNYINLSIVGLVYITLILTSCIENTSKHISNGVDIMTNADLVACYERDGYDEVIISNTKGTEVAHYILRDRNDASTVSIPENAIEIKVPIMKVIIDSEIYASVFEELGETDLIAGMFDTNYVTSPKIREKIKRNEIKDFGNTSLPNAEQIVEMAPDVIFISYFDGMQTQTIDKLGIPIIKMYDLQEDSPLGRAEWIRIFGRLTKREEKADSIFQEVCRDYVSLRETGSGEISGQTPKILTEMIYNGVWSVPGGQTYQSAIIHDGGGNYFKASDTTQKTLNLSPEQVIIDGADADIWLIKYYGNGEKLRKELENEPLYREIKAYKEGNIYYSDTSVSGLFREFPFHPERLLRDYKIIFSGIETDSIKYFTRLK